jgi:hypothetical protein
MTATNPSDFSLGHERISVEKISSRCWGWSVLRGREVVAGGFCSSKGAANTDAETARASYWIDENRKVGLIATGDVVKIKKEWQDAGDENYTFFAVDCQFSAERGVRVRAVHNTDGREIIGKQYIQPNMIEG